MKGNRIITIGRQIGSGGSEIGMEVAKRLGIQCYDRQLIEMACDYGELDQDILAEAEEKRPNPFLYSVPRQMQNDKTGRGIAINDMVFNLQSEVIRQRREGVLCDHWPLCRLCAAGAAGRDFRIYLCRYECPDRVSYGKTQDHPG